MSSIMVTGMGHKLLEGKSDFKDYVMGWARAFVYDAPDPLPERFELDPYYQKSVDGKQARLNELLSMTTEQRVAHGQKLIERERERFNQREADRKQEKQAALNAWQAYLLWEPGPNLEGIQNKVRDELVKALAELERESWKDFEFEYAMPDVIFARELADAERSLNWAVDGLVKAKENNELQNAWLAELRASLNAA